MMAHAWRMKPYPGMSGHAWTIVPQGYRIGVFGVGLGVDPGLKIRVSAVQIRLCPLEIGGGFPLAHTCRIVPFTGVCRRLAGNTVAARVGDPSRICPKTRVQRSPSTRFSATTAPSAHSGSSRGARQPLFGNKTTPRRSAKSGGARCGLFGSRSAAGNARWVAYDADGLYGSSDPRRRRSSRFRRPSSRRSSPRRPVRRPARLSCRSKSRF